MYICIGKRARVKDEISIQIFSQKFCQNCRKPPSKKFIARSVLQNSDSSKNMRSEGAFLLLLLVIWKFIIFRIKYFLKTQTFSAYNK